jgi:hypothetical protein
MLNSFKNYGLIGLLILLPIFSIASYQKGKSAGANQVKQYYAKIEQDNNKYWQDVVNKLNESANQTRLNQQSKYESLNNEFLKISDNLSNCKFNVNQLRVIKSSASLQISADSSVGNAARAREFTNSESAERFTCQDSGITMIAWSKQYFSCKTKLDYLQELVQSTQ